MPTEIPPHVPRYGHPEYYDVHIDNRQRQTPMTNITVPLILVFVGGVGLVTATFYATRELADVHSTLQTISRDVSQLRGKIEQDIEELQEDLKHRTANRWSKYDHDVWCAKTEALNSAIGWKCAPVTEAEHIEAQRRWRIQRQSQKGWSPKAPSR